MNHRSRIIVALLALAGGIVAVSFLFLPKPRQEGDTLTAKTGSSRSNEAVPRGPRQSSPLTSAATMERLAPLLAAQRVMEMPPGPDQDRALREAAGVFVQQAPDGALAWALELPDAPTRGAALEIVARELVRRDARGTRARLTALPSGSAADEALAAAAGHWARENAADALAWLQDIHDASQRARLLGSIGYELAETDPVSALRHAA